MDGGLNMMSPGSIWLSHGSSVECTGVSCTGVSCTGECTVVV